MRCRELFGAFEVVVCVVVVALVNLAFANGRFGEVSSSSTVFRRVVVANILNRETL